jgi:hypothetical protein
VSDLSDDEPVLVRPFTIIQPGEDSVDADDKVSFADFRPVVVPSDTVEGGSKLLPKDESARELASLPELPSTKKVRAPRTSEKPALESAPLADGKTSHIGD